jgi:hypothetical protein
LAGSSKLTDFTLVETQRPLLTIKKVLTGEAECALIDDAQLAELAHIEGAEGIRSIWDSQKLPPMVMVAFPAAPRTERQEFRENLPHVCDGDARSICAAVGIISLRPATGSPYAAVVAAYGP